jgi:hypothetical protein
MRSITTRSGSRAVRTIGLVSMIAGLLMIVAGGFAWGTVSSQLAAQNITVAEDASFMPGATVDGPLSAFAQAQVIDEHSLAATDGLTFAEMDREDPLRETALNGSLLRASLFTSVLAFGVSALVMGLGLLFGLMGWGLRRLGAESETTAVFEPTAVETREREFVSA